MWWRRKKRRRTWKVTILWELGEAEDERRKTRGRYHCGQMWEGRKLCEVCQVKLERGGRGVEPLL